MFPARDTARGEFHETVESFARHRLGRFFPPGCPLSNSVRISENGIPPSSCSNSLPSTMSLFHSFLAISAKRIREHLLPEKGAAYGEAIVRRC